MMLSAVKAASTGSHHFDWHATGLASWARAGAGQGTPPVPVLGPLERPELEDTVGHLALICPRDHSESG